MESVLKRPNILILYTDQQRWDALGANGNREIRTPHLDRLAAEGLTFSHYFVQNPVCMPSRVSFLSGRYPSSLGITHMGVPVPADTATLPRRLRNYGYVSGNIIEKHREDSWLCVAGFYSPHAPWVAPQPFLDLYDPQRLSLPPYPPEVEARRRLEGRFSDDELRSVKHGYYAMISEVDHHVGRILEKLEQLGLENDTIVVFTSDHGEYLGEHLRYGKGHPGEDCVSRVPLIVRDPRRIRQPGRTVEAIVEAVDVVPTLLECAGIPLSADLQGLSFRPALENEPFEGKGCALMEFTGWKSIRTRTHRYLCEACGREALHDLEADPMQYSDVSEAAEQREVLQELRKRLLVATLRNEQPLRRVWPY